MRKLRLTEGRRQIRHESRWICCDPSKVATLGAQREIELVAGKSLALSAP